MAENLYVQYFRRGTCAQNLQTTVEIKYRGTKTANIYNRMDELDGRFRKEETQRGNSYFEKCLTTLVMRKMQIETTLR